MGIEYESDEQENREMGLGENRCPERSGLLLVTEGGEDERRRGRPE